MRTRVLTRAYRDIVDIWNYIANDNPDAADEQEERFFAAIRQLGEQPGLGHPRSDVRDARYRFWRVGNYQIAYRVRGKELTVCRIVHSARAFGNCFERPLAVPDEKGAIDSRSMFLGVNEQGRGIPSLARNPA